MSPALSPTNFYTTLFSSLHLLLSEIISFICSLIIFSSLQSKMYKGKYILYLNLLPNAQSLVCIFLNIVKQIIRWMNEWICNPFP